MIIAPNHPATKTITVTSESDGTASTTTDTRNLSPNTGNGIILGVVVAVASGPAAVSCTAANGDNLILLGTANVSGTSFDLWYLPSSAGGSFEVYTTTLNAVNARLWLQSFSYPVHPVLAEAGGGTTMGPWQFAPNRLAISCGRTPTNWPPTGFTVVGSAGSSHCAQDLAVSLSEFSFAIGTNTGWILGEFAY